MSANHFSPSIAKMTETSVNALPLMSVRVVCHGMITSEPYQLVRYYNVGIAFVPVHYAGTWVFLYQSVDSTCSTWGITCSITCVPMHYTDM